MKTTGSLVKLIIFMVVTSLLTFVLAATIGTLPFTGNSKTYHAMFTDVTGLIPGSEVRNAGVKVGSVDGISLKGNLAKVTFELDGGYYITDANTLQIRYRNLVGERYIAIQEGAGGGNRLNPGSTVNDVSYEIIQTLQGEGGTFDTLLANTASLTKTLADKDAVIGRVVDNLTTVLATVDQRDTDLSNLIAQLKRLATGFADDRTAIGQSIQGIGNLTTDTANLLIGIRPSLKNDISRLGVLAANLDKGKSIIDGVLARLPEKLNRIVATASYGGWFNFYLCGLQVSGVTVVNSAARCQR